jgi:acyl carrier protein
MREGLDLDSIDLPNLVITICARTGKNIPKADYHHFFAMSGTIAYLARQGGPYSAGRLSP